MNTDTGVVNTYSRYDFIDYSVDILKPEHDSSNDWSARETVVGVGVKRAYEGWESGNKLRPQTLDKSVWVARYHILAGDNTELLDSTIYD